MINGNTTASAFEKINREALAQAIAGSTTLRVQPVKPDREGGGELAIQLIGTLVVLFLGAWFVCLGTLSAHGYWPVVPALAYWPTVGMLLGFQTITAQLRSRAWKWARL